MDILESGEMYLETIYVLRKSGQAVKSVDVVRYTQKAKSTVSRAINILKDRGFITVDINGNIDFTSLGLERVEEVYKRHQVLTEYLIRIGVSAEVAELDACRMEHIISAETLDAIKKQTGK